MTKDESLSTKQGIQDGRQNMLQSIWQKQDTTKGVT